jgi:hypothetical protein
VAEHVDAAAIAELERAELAARELRLTAVAEAEGLLEAARVTACDVEAGSDELVTASIERSRREHLARAEAEVAAIDEELARLDAAPDGVDVPPAAFDAAVEHVVALVLGEPGG